VTLVLFLTVLVGASVLVVKLLKEPRLPLREPWLDADTLHVPLYPDGREIFTSNPLLGGRVYEVCVAGVYSSWALGLWPQEADAVYDKDAQGNFTHRHHRLLVNGKAVATTKPEGWQEDRAAHSYTFLLDGNGQRIPVRLARGEGCRTSPLLEAGVAVAPLVVRFVLLPAGTPTVAEREGARDPAIVPAVSSTPPVKSSGVDLEIPACDVDVFSSVLMAGRVYRLKFSGTYKYNGACVADAVYYDDFQSSYTGLTIDGKTLREQDSWQEDRKNHDYTCLVEAAGKRLKFRLRTPGGYQSGGGVLVNIEEMPLGTKTARMLEHEEFCKSVQTFQLQEQQRHAEACRGKVEELRRFVHCHENFLNPKFRAEYLRNHQQDLLTTLRPEWTEEYEAVFADPALVAVLKTEAPEVLRWHEERIKLILAAERAEEMPAADTAADSMAEARQITPSTMPYVSQAITELFQFTDLYSRERQALAQDRNQAAHRPNLERFRRAMAFYYEDLARFGIHAKTPEQAELQYFQRCPPPAPSYYEELTGRIKTGETVSADPIRARVEDLFREELKLKRQRGWAVERKKGGERDTIDERLALARRERHDLQGFLESIGYEVKFEDYREQEPSLGEGYLSSWEQQKKLQQILMEAGDEEAAKQVGELFAGERAKLLEQDSSGY
jgi:hypothetical protein